jgi:hypothetical protein
VTGGAVYDSVHYALLESVATIIRGMLGSSIIGPASDSVIVRKIPWAGDFGSIDPNTMVIAGDKKHAWPAIIICPFDLETLDPLAGTNARDEIGYPVAVTFWRPNNTAGSVASEAGADPFLRWREAVERTFTHLRGVRSTAGQLGYLDVTANGKSYTFHDCKPKAGTIFDYARCNPDSGSFDFGWLQFSFILWRPGGA